MKFSFLLPLALMAVSAVAEDDHHHHHRGLRSHHRHGRHGGGHYHGAREYNDWDARDYDVFEGREDCSEKYFARVQSERFAMTLRRRYSMQEPEGKKNMKNQVTAAFSEAKQDRDAHRACVRKGLDLLFRVIFQFAGENAPRIIKDVKASFETADKALAMREHFIKMRIEENYDFLFAVHWYIQVYYNNKRYPVGIPNTYTVTKSPDPYTPDKINLARFKMGSELDSLEYIVDTFAPDGIEPINLTDDLSKMLNQLVGRATVKRGTPNNGW